MLSFASSFIYADTQNIELNSGWNLIGFDGTPANQDVTEILTNGGQVEGAVLPEMQEKSKAYLESFAAIPGLNTLKRIDSHSGYYIKSTEDGVMLSVEISADSTLYGTQSVGWNLFSPGASENIAIDDFVDSLAQSGVTVSEVQSKTQSWLLALAAIPGLNTLSAVESGKGYWIKATAVTSAVAGMQDSEAASSSEAQVSSMTAPDGKTLRVLVPSIKTSIGTDAVTAGETTYNIPALPVAVYANSAEDNDTSVIVDSAYAGEKVVMQLTDTTSGAVTYTSIAALDSAGGVNASGTTDDSGQAGTFE